MALGKDILRSFHTSQDAQHQKPRVLTYHTCRTGHYGDYGFLHTVLPSNISKYISKSNNHFLSIISELVYYLLATHWRLLDISSPTLLWSSQFPLLRFLPCSVDVFWFFLLHCVVLSHLAPISSNDAFGNVVRRLHRISSWCIAVPTHYVSNKIALTHMIHNVIDCVISQHVS